MYRLLLCLLAWLFLMSNLLGEQRRLAGLSPEAAAQADATPAAVLYLPLIAERSAAAITPTSTPTGTALATATPLPTAQSSKHTAQHRLEVESYDAMQGIVRAGTGIGYLDEGDWVRFDAVNFGGSGNGYRLEVAIPLAAVGINLPPASSGYEFGLDVHVNEDDDGGVRENKLAWNASADEAWRNPNFFGLANLAATGTPAAKTYYVSDANGNDANSGITVTNALKTIQAAADRTLPGDSVLVMNGTYTLQNQGKLVLHITRAGRSDAWITYKAYPGHRPLIQNANHWGTVAIEANYIIFDGFDVRGVNARYTLDQARANFEDYIHNRYPNHNPQIPGLMGYGIKISAFNIIRKNRVFQHGGTGIALAQTGPSDYLLIEDNAVYENAWYTAFCESGINIWQPRHVNGGPTTWLDGSQYKIIVRRNIAHSNYNYFPCSDEDEHGNRWTSVTDGNGIILDRFDTISFPNEPDYNEPVLVENNITYNNGGAGILTFYVEHADIVNNVAYHNGQHPDLKQRSGIFVNESGSGVNVINNIVVASPGQLLTHDNGSRGQIIHYNYNLYYADGGNTILKHKQGAHDRVADPRFVLPSTDPAQADFHLRVGSPAIDSGSDAYLPSVDGEGIARVAGAVNRGVYERVSDATLLTISVSLAPSAPIIDGEVDTLWNTTTAYPIAHTIDGDRAPESDLNATFKAIYDADHLYLLADVIDDAKRNDSGEQWWEDDAVEIYLDGDKSRATSYDGVNDYQLVFRWNDANLIVGPNSKAAPTGLQPRMVNTASGYRLEVAIPLAAVGIHPPPASSGYEFGLDVHVLDDDDGGTRENKLAWNAWEDESWRNPTFFGVAKLSTTPQTGRSIFPQLEVEQMDESQGIQSWCCGIGYLDEGDWVRYKQVDFGTGATTFFANLAVPAEVAGKQIEIRIDRLDGTLLGRLTTQSTGSWDTYAMQQVDISSVNGIHDLYLVFRGGNGVANLDWVRFAPITSPPAPTNPIPAEFFGMHIHRAATGVNGQPFWPDAPFRFWRLHDADHLHWYRLETAQNQWDFSLFDKAIAQAEAHGILPFYTLGQTPNWASARPNEPGAYGVNGAAAEPANLEDWRDYVRTVATRYKGQIKHYEIWNEADLKDFYSGDVATMVQMASEAYAILKSIDPTITVVAPSITSDLVQFRWLEQFLAQGGGNYYDVNSVHFYIPAAAKPETIYAIAVRIHKFLRSKGQDHKPLWNTETGFGRTLENVFITGDDAVGFVARAHIVQWLAGVDQFDWYSWDNRHWVGLYFVEADLRTPTAAAVAYGETVKWLRGAQLQNCELDGAGTWVCRLTSGDGRPAWIVWNPEQRVNYTLPNTVHTLRTLAGEVQTISGSGTVVVGAKPVYLVGD